MSTSPTRRALVALAVTLATLLAACSSSSSKKSPAAGTSGTTTAAAGASSGAATFPVTVQSAQGPVTVKAQPKAVISLSPTATEDLFAIGAGPQVTAVDDQSNFPTEAPKTDLSGFQPNVEAIAARKPDLVVVADDSAGVSAALGKVGVAVLVEPAAKNLDEAMAQIGQLGQATGHTSEAAALVTRIRGDVGKIVASAPKPARPVRIYHEVDQTFYSATSSTFIGQLYKTLGAENIADPADKDGSGYPQLSPEFIVKANPDAIFLSDAKCCGQSLQTVAARPGWSGINAVKSGTVISLSEDVASRWGPRVVDLVQAIADGMAKVPAGGPNG